MCEVRNVKPEEFKIPKKVSSAPVAARPAESIEEGEWLHLPSYPENKEEESSGRQEEAGPSSDHVAPDHACPQKQLGPP